MTSRSRPKKIRISGFPLVFGRLEQVLPQIPRHQLVQVHGRVLPLINAVGAVGVGHHREALPVGDELVDQFLKALIVDVVVARPMDDEQVPLELGCESDGRPFLNPSSLSFGKPI